MSDELITFVRPNGEEYEVRAPPPGAYELLGLDVCCRVRGGGRVVVEWLFAEGFGLLLGGESGWKVAVAFYDGPKWVQVRDVATPAGQRKLEGCLARMDEAEQALSFWLWRVDEPFFDSEENMIVGVSTVVAHGGVKVDVDAHRRLADRVQRFAGALGEVVEFTAGGAFTPGGWWPMWVRRVWRVEPLEEPLVSGPLWLLAVSAAAHGRLVGSARVRELAVGWTEFGWGGGLWQLSEALEGPSGPVLEEWFELFFELGVMVGR
jgi:hypothetical protein